MRLGVTNRIVNCSNSDTNKFRRWLQCKSDFNDDHDFDINSIYFLMFFISSWLKDRYKLKRDWKRQLKDWNNWLKDWNCQNQSKLSNSVKINDENVKICQKCPFFQIYLLNFWSNSNSDLKSVSNLYHHNDFDYISCLIRIENVD